MEEKLMQEFLNLMNWPAFLLATLIPTIIGMIWYSPKLPTGAAWMRESGMTEEKMKGSNMALMMILSLIFAFLMNFFIVSHEVIHQYGGFSLLNNHPEEAYALLVTYKNEFRTFKHGAFHGALLGLFFVFPLFALNGMFERKSWKLIIVNSVYWILCLIIMGGILCAWQ